MPRVILWDLMDTLIHDPFYSHVPQFFGLSFDALIAAKHPSAWGEFELGRIDEATLFARFFTDERSFDGAALKRCMVEHARWIAGMPELLGELSARGVPMHVLSNYGPWYRDYDAHLGLSRYVKLSFVSCHTGVRKPAPAAFLTACSSLGVAPDDCVLVDDRRTNVEAARAVGLSAVRFCNDVAALRAELTALGIGNAP